MVGNSLSLVNKYNEPAFWRREVLNILDTLAKTNYYETLTYHSLKLNWKQPATALLLSLKVKVSK